MITISGMSRWLPRDVTNMPLRQIELEIAQIQETPQGERTINSCERLADLYEAMRRIKSGGCRGFF